MTTATRPPQPEAPGKKLVYAAVPAPDWRVAGDGALCGFRHGGRDIGCADPAVAERNIPGMAIYPWRAYCEVHAAQKGHWVQDGTVMTWDLRKPGREDVPLTARDVARMLGGEPGWCSPHKRLKSGCPPWSRHNHSNRFRDDDWQATGRTAEDAGLAGTALIAHGMEAMQGYLRCDRGRCAEDGPSVPVIWGNLAGRPLGEWLAEAGNRVRDQHPRHEPVTVGAVKP